MTGIEIFIGGGLLLCCATMTAWLIFDARQRTAKPSSPKHDKPELPNKADDGQCCVGKSTFDIDYDGKSGGGYYKDNAPRRRQ